jgi:hypothetical protein
VLGEPLDLSDLLMADNREYRALWARHYLGLEPPYELAQAVNVWQNSSGRAALKAADAAGEALSLLPQGANAADTAYQEALRAKLKSGRGVYGGTWLVNDTQILVPSVVPVGQKQSVTSLSPFPVWPSEDFQTGLKTCPKRFRRMHCVTVDLNPSGAGFTPQNNPVRVN